MIKPIGYSIVRSRFRTPMSIDGCAFLLCGIFGDSQGPIPSRAFFIGLYM